MRKYEITKFQRMCFKHLEFHENSTSCIKRAIITMAYDIMGMTQQPLNEHSGIFKYEGGVSINSHEIAIKDYYVVDDWDRSQDETREEVGVAMAIEKLAKHIEDEKIFKYNEDKTDVVLDKDSAWLEFVQTYTKMSGLYGDPLRNLCGV